MLLPSTLRLVCSLSDTSVFCYILIDVGTAIAAVTCLRSLAAFLFPLFAPVMYSALGFGKGNTVLALVAIVIGCPA